jgi:hypothetical protein
MRKLLMIALASAFAMLVAAPVAQAAPTSDKITGSGTWSGGNFGTPTVNVNANDQSPAGKNNNKFTFDYKNPAGETIYLVQGKIVEFTVTGTTACLVGQVTKEQGTDPYNTNVDPNADRFVLGGYVPIAISKGGPTGYTFNFGRSQPTDPGLCTINPDIPFDPGAAFTIVDAS